MTDRHRHEEDDVPNLGSPTKKESHSAYKFKDFFVTFYYIVTIISIYPCLYDIVRGRKDILKIRA